MIRICWPTPDATCLEGGCGYCQYAKPRSLTVVVRWAKKAGQVPNRCGGNTQDALAAFKNSGRIS